MSVKAISDQESNVKAKDIGIDANPPKEVCNDINCPWHGHIKIRGRVFIGKVVSTRMTKSAVVEWSYIKKSKKYRRYMRAKTKITVHVPPCIILKPGDAVKIGETRPISKTKSFVVIEKLGE